MGGLKAKVAKLEEIRRRRRGEEPYVVKSDDGRVEAKITPLPGRPPAAWITVNDLYLDPNAALELIRPMLPTNLSSIFVFPRKCESEEEWDVWVEWLELRQRWQGETNENPTLHLR